jgi:hypothetical protein
MTIVNNSIVMISLKTYTLEGFEPGSSGQGAVANRCVMLLPTRRHKKFVQLFLSELKVQILEEKLNSKLSRNQLQGNH